MAGSSNIRLSPFQYGESMAKQSRGKDYYNPYQNPSQRKQFKLGWDSYLRRTAT